MGNLKLLYELLFGFLANGNTVIWLGIIIAVAAVTYWGVGRIGAKIKLPNPDVGVKIPDNADNHYESKDIVVKQNMLLVVTGYLCFPLLAFIMIDYDAAKIFFWCFSFIPIMIFFNDSSKAILNSSGITKKNLWGKSVSVSWDAVDIVDLVVHNWKLGTKGFAIRIHTDSGEKHSISVNYIRTNYTKSLELLIKKLPKDKFTDESKNKLYQLGILENNVNKKT